MRFRDFGMPGSSVVDLLCRLVGWRLCSCVGIRARLVDSVVWSISMNSKLKPGSWAHRYVRGTRFLPHSLPRAISVFGEEVLSSLRIPVWFYFTWLCMGQLGLHSAVPDKTGVKPNVISLPSGAGSIEGLGESFEPQLNTGSATYGVSIALPPGRAGLQPSIRLSYDSNAGNGIGGLGWSIEFGSIKRQTDKGFPDYSDADTFLYQGEELVPLNNAGRDWRCENDRGFQRLRQIDSDRDGSMDAWEVTERNGIRHTFGRQRGAAAQWSVVENAGKAAASAFDRTYCWMLDSTTDLHGNEIHYEYLQGAGVLYPARVFYSELGGARHEVSFFYEDRLDAFDDYRPAFSARLDKRLRRIEVRTQDQLVRAYGFAYEHGEGDLNQEQAASAAQVLDLGVSLLKRVTQYDRSGSDANYFPPLIFTYSGLNPIRAEQRSLTAIPELDLSDPAGRVQLADLDGDGLPDLYATLQSGAGVSQQAALNRGETRGDDPPRLEFAPAQQVLGTSPVDLAEPDTVVHDPKGKGLVDLSCLVADGANKRLETFANRAHLDGVDPNRLGFNPEEVEQTPLIAPPSYVTYSEARTRQVDANFDKRGDFVNLEPGFGGMKVNTFYRARSGAWLEGQSTLPPSYPLANTFDTPDGKPNPCVQLADMNGDRLLDLVCLAPEQEGANVRIRVSYWPLCGLGRYAEERQMATLPTDSFLVPSADLRDVLVEDFTGDGLADVLILDGSGEQTVLQLRVNIAGQRWSASYERSGLPRYKPRDLNQPTVLRTADLNGNGSIDLLFVNPAAPNWYYFDLLPKGKPSLLTGIDNSLGKRTTIVYGSAADDAQRARASGHPWKTVAPIALQVVRQIRVQCGQDLNGDGREDTAVAEFSYRDPYYDGYEREFRGFSFAQRIDYGDDFLFEPTTGLMQVSEGWNRAKTPTGQVSGPSLVTRFRFHTGAADQRDNDDYGNQVPVATFTDEFTEVGGREEEALKGVLLVEEKVDPAVLHGGSGGGFDAGGEAAVVAREAAAQRQLTPSRYVYTRSISDWVIRRLYRPDEPLSYFADQNGDGLLEDYRSQPATARPAGRFAAEGVWTMPENGRSVSFAYARDQWVEQYEANGLLAVDLGYPVRAARTRRKTFDYDNYGNERLIKDWGRLDEEVDDERVTTRTYALGGNALALWVIDRPDVVEVTDEAGLFVSRQIHYYDGDPLVGLRGVIQSRALPHRTVQFTTAQDSLQATRARFDAWGNIVESLDPNGNVRRVVWDAVLKAYPVREEIVVDPARLPLAASVAYDLGFGVVTLATNFNGHLTRYHYDSFGRLVKIVQPGDTDALPTSAFEYQPADPVRGRAYEYDAVGNLSLRQVALGSMSRVTTRQRERAGEVGEFVTARFTDGCGKKLASIEESETPGRWIVKEASSYNLRLGVKGLWQPFEIGSLEVPQFTQIWPSGRPPLSDSHQPEILASEIRTDPLGREIQTVLVPESWGGQRRFALTQHLPLETWLFDSEDTRIGSVHQGTPYVQHRDGLGRMVGIDEQVRLTDLGEPGTLTSWRTRYDYDLNDQLTRIEDSQGNVKTMQYDGLKRLITLNDPDRGVMAFRYDDASNLKESADAKGQIIRYTYDGANRIRSEDYLDGNPRGVDVEYVYDEAAPNLDLGDGTRGQAENPKGQLASVKDLSGETHFSYDARGRMVWEVKRIPDLVTGGLFSYRTQVAFDSMDRLERLTYPDGDEIQQRYNPRSQLTRVQGALLGDVVRSIRYRPSGQLDAVIYGNQVQTHYSYDPRLRLTRLQTTNAQGSALIDLEYQFDGVSNIEQIADRRSLLNQAQAAQRFNTQIFGYDNLYRLTSARYPGLGSGHSTNQVVYRYDRIGNMVSQTSTILDASDGRPLVDLGRMESGGSAGRFNRLGRKADDPPGPHALTLIESLRPGIAPRAFRYDANGNVVEMEGLTNRWDYKDRLIEVRSATLRAVYTYDYTDRRISKTVYPNDPAGAVTSVSYVNRYFEVREGESLVKYVWQGDTRVARMTAQFSGQQRIQRVRLSLGWNHVFLTVGGQFPQLSREQNADVGVSGYGSPVVGETGWVEIKPTTTVPAGVTAWIYAHQETVVLLRGTPAVLDLPPLTGGTQFLGNPLNEPIRLNADSQPGLWIARYEPGHQQWRHRFGNLELQALAGQPDPLVILPGQAFWTRGGSGRLLANETAALRLRYYHQDHLGSSAVISDADGQLVSETAYYAFGLPRHEFNPRSLKDPYQFTQKERDAESGLSYFEARYLGGSMPVFLCPDPLAWLMPRRAHADPQRHNPYSYCSQRPLIYVDPSGLESKPNGESGGGPSSAPAPQQTPPPSSPDAPSKTPEQVEAEFRDQPYSSVGRDCSAYVSADLGSRGHTDTKSYAGGTDSGAKNIVKYMEDNKDKFEKSKPEEAKQGCYLYYERAKDGAAHIERITGSPAKDMSRSDQRLTLPTFGCRAAGGDAAGKNGGKCTDGSFNLPFLSNSEKTKNVKVYCPVPKEQPSPKERK
jgi:RHS repeat-associated protein